MCRGWEQKDAQGDEGERVTSETSVAGFWGSGSS